MKKWFGAIFLIVLVVGLFTQVDFGVAQPTIKADGKSIKVVQGSYCWSSFIKSQCASMPTPPDLIKMEKINPIIVKPEEKIEITFKNPPTEYGINLWSGNTSDVSLQNNILIAPSEPGIYIYDVYGHWPNGDSASSAFTIEVEDNN